MENEKNWNHADSHSGILKQEAEELDIHVLPMPFYLNGELFHEDLDFSRTGFYEKLREGADVSTSQPSPQEVMEMWDEMLYLMIRSSTFR